LGARGAGQNELTLHQVVHQLQHGKKEMTEGEDLCPTCPRTVVLPFLYGHHYEHPHVIRYMIARAGSWRIDNS